MGSSYFPEEILHRIRQEADIVRVVSDHISLKKAGQNWKGLCPFHSEKTPSFTVSSAKQFYHCFGCGAGGDVIGFLMKMDGMTFPQAVRSLADQAGIPIPVKEDPGLEERARLREETFRVQKEAADFFHEILLKEPENSPVKKYLSRRRVSQEMIRKFYLGYAPPGWNRLGSVLGEKGWSHEKMEQAGLITRKEHQSAPASKPGGESARRYYDRFRDRLIFPIWDLQKRVVGFGGRVIGEGSPKYLNSPETVVFKKGGQLYGLEKAREEAGKKGFLVIVEGYMDALSLHEAGFEAVAATLGTALTEEHLRLIRRFVPSVKLVFDGDEAGVRAALRAVDILIPSSVSGEVVLLPPGEDPDSYVKKNGIKAFDNLLKRAERVMDFSIRHGLSGQKSGSIEEKLLLVDRLLPVIRKIKRPIERKYYVRELAEQLGLDESELFRELGGTPGTRPPETGGGIHQGTPALPPEEKILVQLLIHNPSDISIVSPEIQPGDFSDQGLRKVYSSILETAEKGGGPLNAGRLSEGAVSSERLQTGREVLGLVSALSLEEPVFEDSRQTLLDCVKTIRGRNIRSEMKAIEIKIRNAEKTGDGRLVTNLQTELINLKKKAVDINVLS